MTTDKKKKFIINSVFIAIIALIIVFVLKYLTALLLPFVIGLVVAIILNRPITFLTRKTKIPRGIWSFIFVITSLAIVFSLIGLIGYRIFVEFESYVTWVISNKDSLLATFNEFSEVITGFMTRLPEEISAMVEDTPEKLVTTGITFLSNNLSTFAATAISGVPNLIIAMILAVISSVFIAADYPHISAFFHAQLGEKALAITQKSKVLFKENILKMLRGYIIILFITFLELFLGLTILRVNYAWLLAIIIAIMDILPVLGTGLALIPWAIVELFTGAPLRALGIIIIYLFITVIRQVIEPKIIGKQVGLSPVLTLIAMYSGLKLFGVFGLIGFPITLIVLIKLHECGMIGIWKDVKKEEPEPTEKKKDK